MKIIKETRGLEEDHQLMWIPSLMSCFSSILLCRIRRRGSLSIHRSREGTAGDHRWENKRRSLLGTRLWKTRRPTRQSSAPTSEPGPSQGSTRLWDSLLGRRSRGDPRQATNCSWASALSMGLPQRPSTATSPCWGCCGHSSRRRQDLLCWSSCSILPPVWSARHQFFTKPSPSRQHLKKFRSVTLEMCHKIFIVQIKWKSRSL